MERDPDEIREGGGDEIDLMVDPADAAAAAKKKQADADAEDDALHDDPVELPEDEAERVLAKKDDEPARRPAAEDDDDDSNQSRAVRKRINREVALRRQVEARLARSETTNLEMRERVAKLERANSASVINEERDKSVKAIDAKIAEIKTKLIAHEEAGETAKKIDLEVELQTLIAERVQVIARAELKAEEAQKAVEANKEVPDDDRDPAAKQSSEWIRQNRKWWNLNRFRDARADAVELDKQIQDEINAGDLDFEAYSDEHLAELSTRLKASYPDLDVRGLDGESVESEEEDEVPTGRTQRDETNTRGNKPRRPAAGNMGTRDGRRGRNTEVDLAQQGRVRLGKADYATMREYGLNPNDKDHVRRFAKERLRTIVTESGVRK